MHRTVTALAALGALGLAACVLFVPSPKEDVGGTCGLTSDEQSTSCGACVAESCREVLDACCADGAACEGAIEGIVSCGSDATKCAPAGASAAEGALRTCVATRCKAKCGDGAPLVPDAAKPPTVDCQTSLETCFCVATSDGGTTSAPSSCRTSSSSKGARCCAETGYPGVVGKRCACRQAQCVESGSSCSCGYYSSSTTGAVATCNGKLRLCCRDAVGTSCSCKTNLAECAPNEMETASCSVADLACLVDDDGKVTNPVSSCSP